MTRLFRYFLLVILLTIIPGVVFAQQTAKIQGVHKVKKKETIFGISKKYGLTITELIEANPEINTPGYELKKGAELRIPYPSQKKETTTVSVAAVKSEASTPAKDDVRRRAIRLGVMLPLHNINGDGRRMTEYYRGVLMACDSLKRLGISVDVHAWNTAEDGNISDVLKDPAAARCDLIIGPLYSKQMDALSRFVEKHDILLVIPFSINAPQLTTNRNIFQIWQSHNDQNASVVNFFTDQFKNYHSVIIDCNDSTSTKGAFTSSLRRKMEQQGMEYALTNLKSDENQFVNAFSKSKPNVVVLNTGRSQELGVAFSKINGMVVNNPNLDITMFGYTDWLMYTRRHLDNFYKYNTFIPSVFYYNPLTMATQRFEQKYRSNFHSVMMNSLPRFSITGFDHAYFFLRGIHKYGKSFNGTADKFGYSPIQTPLRFERYGNGGLRNRTQLFVHYKPGQVVETIRF